MRFRGPLRPAGRVPCSPAKATSPPALHAEHDLRHVPVPGPFRCKCWPRPTCRSCHLKFQDIRTLAVPPDVLPRQEPPRSSTAQVLDSVGDRRPSNDRNWRRPLPHLRRARRRPGRPAGRRCPRPRTGNRRRGRRRCCRCRARPARHRPRCRRGSRHRRGRRRESPGRCRRGGCRSRCCPAVDLARRSRLSRPPPAYRITDRCPPISRIRPSSVLSVSSPWPAAPDLDHDPLPPRLLAAEGRRRCRRTWRRSSARGRVRMCPVRPAPKAVIRAATHRADLRDAEELLGIVAGVSSSRSSCSSYLMASGIASSQRSPASTAAACEPMAGIASQHASRADVGRLRVVRVRERQDGSSTTLLLVAGGRERNYG